MATILSAVVGASAAATLLSAATAAVITTALGGNLSPEAFMSNAVTAGGPIALGAAVGNYFYPPSGKDAGNEMLMRIGLGTASTVGILIAAGMMPATLDAETLTMGTLAAASIWAGDAMVMSKFIL